MTDEVRETLRNLWLIGNGLTQAQQVIYRKHGVKLERSLIQREFAKWSST
jgi:hypothetical protein